MRRKALSAYVEVFADRGFERTELVDLLAAAPAIDSFAFRADFGDKQASFLAAYDQLVADASARIAACASPADPGPERLAAGLARLLAIVDEHPTPSRFVFLEARTATAATRARYRMTVRSAATFLRGGRGICSEQLPASIEVVLAGGLGFMIAEHLKYRGGEPASHLYEAALRFLLSPYLSHSEAEALLARAVSAPR